MEAEQKGKHQLVKKQKWITKDIADISFWIQLYENEIAVHLMIK